MTLSYLSATDLDLSVLLKDLFCFLRDVINHPFLKNRQNNIINLRQLAKVSSCMFNSDYYERVRTTMI